MSYDWYDEIERAEQEYDAKENEMAQEYKRGYEQGKADAIDEMTTKDKLLGFLEVIIQGHIAEQLKEQKNE